MSIKAPKTLQNMQGVERLALVSKILFDTRLVELRDENEALKLQLFWNKYNYLKLRNTMKIGNIYGPKCYCVSCFLHSRTDEREYQREVPCTFAPWFERKITDCGMTFGTPTIGEADGGHIAATGAAEWGFVYLDDYHLVNNSCAELPGWGLSGYGAKIWQIKLVDDPELQKLVALFRLLNEDFMAAVEAFE